MVNGQQARKTAKGRHPSLAIVNSALADLPLPKRRTNTGETNIQKNSVPTVSDLLVFPGDAEPPSRERLSLSASVLSLDASPTSSSRSGEISDACQRNVIDLFAKRYIKTFDKDRLGLEGAYTSEATFSCRFISSSPEPPPYHFTKCNTGTLQGASNIVQALSSLSRLIKFVPEAEFVLEATIDVLQLPDMNYFAALAFNTIIEDVDVSVDMAFLLKENARITGRQDRRVLWAPFVVMSHQIVLRS